MFTARVPLTMLLWREAFIIADGVIEEVLVFVVDVIALGDWTKMLFPQVAVIGSKPGIVNACVIALVTFLFAVRIAAINAPIQFQLKRRFHDVISGSS